MADVGRPSKYDPAFCDLLEGHFAEGFSYESFAGVVGVSKQTLYDWEKAHPEFLDAKKAHEAKSQFVWEKRLNILASSGEGNATAIIFGLKNRASDSWRDVKATEISGPDGGAIQAETKISRIELVAPDDDGED